MSKISLKIMFPYIKDAIREINLNNEWADRESIIQNLIRNKEVNEYVAKVRNSKITIDEQVGNIVDWFSAHYTTKSKFMTEYIQEFERKRVSNKSSPSNKLKVWGYKVLTERISEEVDASQINELTEGSVTRILVNKYERNIKARKKCILHYGLNCKVCEFNFKEHYGDIGENFIHVHHVKELNKIRGKYIINPIEDLIPVCANCHSMLHKTHPALLIEELKNKIKNK